MSVKNPVTVKDMLSLIGICPECNNNIKLVRISIKRNTTALYGDCKHCKTSWKYSIECEEI
jgi:transcription elongation factor Elf1